MLICFVMDNIEQGKWKPRRTRGTPSYYYRNRFALVWITLGSAFFTAWSFTPFFRNFNKRLSDGLAHTSEEEISRRYLFNLSKPLRSTKIEEHISSEKELLSQR